MPPETTLTLQEAPQNGHKPKFLFTKENAKHFSARGLAVRRSKSYQEKLAAEKLDSIPDAVPEHVAKRHARVQHQLDLVDGLLVRECEKQHPDAQKLDRLAAASMRLAEQERILAGRPLPGSYKPQSIRGARRANASLGPLEG